jgi:putative tryptophan/tyrosine transport system substrate-binding protein
MKRREFITLLGGVAATWSLAARAQQRPAMPVVGFFNAGSPATSTHRVAAFRQGLRETGFVEGQNLAIEYRWGEDQYDRLPALATDLVQRRVAVIVASPRAVDAAKAATATIPIVFMSGADPVRTGLVASLNRPGGNLTGVTILASDLTAKRFGLLHEAVPQASIIGVLRETSSQGAGFAVQEAEAAARQFGVSIRVMSVDTESEIEAAFATFVREGVGALFVTSSFLFVSLRDRLAALAARYRIPASYDLREFPDVGGLMSNGPSETDAYRQVGRYTGRILKGDKPADLPVMLPTKFEFIINLQTARTLGLTIVPGLLAIADEVIE